MKKFLTIIVTILCLYFIIENQSDKKIAQTSKEDAGKQSISVIPDIKIDNNSYETVTLAKEEGIEGKGPHDSVSEGQFVAKETEEKPKKDEGVLSEEEAKKVVNELLTGIVDTFNRLGEKHNWSFENQPDFTILRPELLKYASTNFTDGFLKDVKNEFYCSCDMPPYPITNLDIRFTLHENTSNRFVASSIEFDNMISSGSTIYYTIVKENGKWVMDQYKWVSAEEEPVHLTWDEIKAYEENQGSQVELLHTTKYEGKKIYIFKYIDTGKTMGVYADNSGYLWDVPSSLLP